MNTALIFLLKSARKIITAIKPPLFSKDYIYNPEISSDLIYSALVSDRPCMIARYGSTEFTCILSYLSIRNKSIFKYLRGESAAFWWDKGITEQMRVYSGFFPTDTINIEKFCQMMIQDSKEVDILGSWLYEKKYLGEHLADTKDVWLDFLLPFLSQNPWSRALKGKKVLVIHPFSETIMHQYTKREHLFKDKNVLPEFDLTVMKAVQSLDGDCNEYSNWFEALEDMKSKIDNIDFDICLIGCGAYGFPLAAHVKRIGKKAVHLGGALQLLFGIRGQRWEDPNLNKDYNIASFMNEYWTRPSLEEKPASAKKVENSCYW